MTAVEWLEKRFYFTKGQLIDIDFEQAKEMEKQHVIDFANYFRHEVFNKKDLEQYYNETFKMK